MNRRLRIGDLPRARSLRRTFFASTKKMDCVAVGPVVILGRHGIITSFASTTSHRSAAKQYAALRTMKRGM